MVIDKEYVIIRMVLFNYKNSHKKSLKLLKHIKVTRCQKKVTA